MPCNTISVFSNLVFKEVEKQSGKSRFSVYKINHRVIMKTVSLECPQLGFFSIKKNSQKWTRGSSMVIYRGFLSAIFKCIFILIVL